jgi:hypothetical protein
MMDMPTSRRQLLRAVGAFGVAGLAGCTSNGAVGAPGQTDSPGRTPTDTPGGSDTTTATETAQCPPSVTPGGTTPTQACPPPPDAFDYAWQHLNEGCQEVRNYDVTPVCGEEAAMGDVRVTVSPSTVGSTGGLTVTLRNEGNTGLTLDGLDIGLFHWYRGYWTRMDNQRGRSSGVPPEVNVPVGETAEWTITQNADALGDPLVGFQYDVATDEIPVRLPPGVYAFGVKVGESCHAASSDCHRYTRRFEVTGEPPALQPSNTVVDTFRQDDTLVVRREPAYDGCESSRDDERIALVLDRHSSIPERFARASLLELYTPWLSLRRPGAKISPPACELLRDAFAHDDGSASRIRVETRIACLHYPESPRPEWMPEEFYDALHTVVYENTAWRLSWTSGWISQ